METVEVFRVEHRTRRAKRYDYNSYRTLTQTKNIRVNLGFFYVDNPFDYGGYGGYDDALYYEWRIPYRMNTPSEDGLVVDSENEFFAFRNLEMLTDVFTWTVRRHFPLADVVVRRYVVEKVRHGRSQSLFDFRTVQSRRIIKVD